MEFKILIRYDQVLDLIKQLPSNQLVRLVNDAKLLLENKEGKKKVTPSAFQQFLLNGPTMNDEQFDTFEISRKAFAQWRVS
jgi:chemotaxis regulatin CheY-phosphate phosphatase CheZ